jgi:hypothetical protein
MKILLIVVIILVIIQNSYSACVSQRTCNFFVDKDVIPNESKNITSLGPFQPINNVQECCELCFDTAECDSFRFYPLYELCFLSNGALSFQDDQIIDYSNTIVGYTVSKK